MTETVSPPLFSVVTVTFRNCAELARTGASVLAQAGVDYEWLVVDGGCDAETAAYLADIADPRLSFVSERDKGIYDGMRKGLERARGDYVIFMNAGDCFAAATTLADVAAAMGNGRPDLVYGDAIESDGDRRFYKTARPVAENRYVMFTHHQAQFYRTAAIRPIGFDLSYSLSADWVLTTRLLRRAGTTTLYVPSALCDFERGGVSQQGGRHRTTMNVELFRIYRTEQHHSWPKAAFLWSKKVGVNKIRSMAPGLYDRLRYR